MAKTRTNWANWSGGVRAAPARLARPRDERELCEVIRAGPPPVRAVGTGHSFTPLCETDGTLVDLGHLSGLKAVDADARLATFGAGTPLYAVGPLLFPHGLALENQGDIDRQTIGGVVGTGTHGTGAKLPSLSVAVAGFRLITADGTAHDCSPQENADIFAAGRVSLGALGVMSEITLRLRPAYRLEEREFLLPADELFARLDELAAANRHFEFFWFPYAGKAVCKTLNETDAPAPEPKSAEAMRMAGERSGGAERLFERGCRILPYAPFLLGPLHRMFTGNMAGRTRVRWSHEIFPSPRTVRFNEMEYAVPRTAGPACLRAIVETIRKERINTGFPIEYRTVAADDIWLSPFMDRDSATIAVHQYAPHDPGPLFAAAEAVFRAHAGRPHWGKRHTRTAEDFAGLYPQFGRFCELRRRLDPADHLLNRHLMTIFG